MRVLPGMCILGTAHLQQVCKAFFEHWERMQRCLPAWHLEQPQLELLKPWQACLAVEVHAAQFGSLHGPCCVLAAQLVVLHLQQLAGMALRAGQGPRVLLQICAAARRALEAQQQQEQMQLLVSVAQRPAEVGAGEQARCVWAAAAVVLYCQVAPGLHRKML